MQPLPGWPENWSFPSWNLYSTLFWSHVVWFSKAWQPKLCFKFNYCVKEICETRMPLWNKTHVFTSLHRFVCPNYIGCAWSHVGRRYVCGNMSTCMLAWLDAGRNYIRKHNSPWLDTKGNMVALWGYSFKLLWHLPFFCASRNRPGQSSSWQYQSLLPIWFKVMIAILFSPR